MAIVIVIDESSDISPEVWSRIMNTLYYVASLRGAGWFSTSSQFTTQQSEAKTMDRDDALALCARYKSAGHHCVPVRVEDMA